MANNINKPESSGGEIYGGSAEEYQTSLENKENMAKEFGDVFIAYDILAVFLI